MVYSILGIILSFLGTAFSLWTILMRDERILHKNAVKEKRYVLVGIALIFVGYALQIAGYFVP